MLKLKTLKFSNIGRFVEEQIINFDNLGSLIQLDAKNNNTGGSSGSGKSTIFHALEWLFGLSDLSTSVLQSRLTKNHISVSGIFDWDGKEVVIQRSRKLSILIQDIETTGNSQITEELLDKIIGIPRKLFRVLLHRRQNEQGFFLSLTSSKMNEFLTDCLGLNVISSKIDLIDEKIKELITNKTEAQNTLQALKASLEATESAISTLGSKPTTEVTEDLLEHYKGLLFNIEKEYNNTILTHKEEQKSLEIKKPIINMISFDKSNLLSLENQIRGMENQINQLLEQEKFRQTNIKQEISNLKLIHNTRLSDIKLENSKESSLIKTKLNELNQIIKEGEEAKVKALKISEQLKILKSGVCHTCEQTWITEKAKLEERKLLGDLEKLKILVLSSIKANEDLSKEKDNYLNLNNKLNDLIKIIESEFNIKIANLNKLLNPQIPENFDSLNEKINILKNTKSQEEEKEKKHSFEQNSNNQKILESFFLEQKILLANQEKELSIVKAEFENTRTMYENAKNRLSTHQVLINSYENNYQSLKNKLIETEQKIVDISKKLNYLTEQVEIAEESKRCLKSYLSCSFDDSLASISDTATRILRAVPTMANATVRLEGTKELGNGAIKDQINACLDSDGEFDIPIKSLSGGERSAVDLAIDLAVSELITERSKIGINLLLLDECMNGFDTAGKEYAIEMLKTLSEDRHVIIVEHDPIVKELISDKIIVSRTDEVSVISNF